MAKKAEPEGAPLYFGLYCSLMTVLLAFFILLTTMADKQESGFHKGMGDIRNAFGLRGGFGLFVYAHLVRGGSMNDLDKAHSEANGIDGLHEDLMAGEGGDGDTDAALKPTHDPRYLRLVLPYTFPDGEAEISEDMARYLVVAGTTLALLDYRLGIKCASRETESSRNDQQLASRRAAAMMRFLHTNCRLPYSQMQAIGYDRLPPQPQRWDVTLDRQLIWLDLYQPPAEPAPKE